MYFLLLALLGLAAANPLAVVETLSETNEQLALRYNLPRESYPTFYDVQLYLNPDDSSGFQGHVSIRLFANQNTQQIVLHAMETNIANIEVFADGGTTNLYSGFTLASDDTHLLRINTNQVLVPNQAYIVNIAYTGQYAANMFGIYVSTYSVPGSNVPANLITSQLQPTFARRAFPCYDEPSIKAVFRTTIYAPAGYPTVRSNMPQRAIPLKPDVIGWVKFEFEDTPVMSTYLIAYLVSNFQYIDNTLNPIYRVPFRIYSRPGTQNTGVFALTFGQENMVALEDYTEFPYVFPKMDKVAAPDFAAGAMENWGLVIYREVALLYTEGVTTTSVRQNIGRIICHENMHMWFGNEVGPWSWTYTWLNEGFANFFENYATDFVRPQWRMMDQYVIALQNVFQSDAVLSVNPMTHPVFSPSQVLGTFNAVAYQKSGSVIRMLQHILTPEVFRQGLVLYIQTLTRSAARPEDLYLALQTALDQSNHTISFRVQEIMDRWTNQGGFPVITAIRDAPSANSITVTQERFLTDRSLTSTDRWIIPVNYVISTNPDFSDTAPQNWVTLSLTARSVDIPGLAQADWYILNKQQTGYYRVNYDDRNWGALAQVLNTTHNVIHVLNRAQIIDDSFNLARNGRLNYGYPLEISRYLVQEQDYIPWAAANAAFNYLDVVLASSDVYDLWQRYVLDLTAPQYQALGFEPQTNEEHVAAYHRTIVLNFNCRYGNAHCVSTAETILNNFVTNNVVPHPDIQTSVYCSGLRGGSAQMYNYLWQQYLQTTDSSLQSIFLNALGCTSNNVTRTEYLQQVINVNSPVREQDRHTIVVSTINASPENMEEALDFVVENFHLIQPRVQGLTGTTNILNAFSRRLTTQAHASKIDELVIRHISILTAGEAAAIAAIRENIAASITWNNIHSATVTAWLQNHFDVATEPVTEIEELTTETPDEPDSANVVTSSVLVFMTFFTVVLNY